MGSFHFTKCVIETKNLILFSWSCTNTLRSNQKKLRKTPMGEDKFMIHLSSLILWTMIFASPWRVIHHELHFKYLIMLHKFSYYTLNKSWKIIWGHFFLKHVCTSTCTCLKLVNINIKKIKFRYMLCFPAKLTSMDI